MTAAEDPRGFETRFHVDESDNFNSGSSHENPSNNPCAKLSANMSDRSEETENTNVAENTETCDLNKMKSSSVSDSLPSEEPNIESGDDEWLDIMGSGDFKKKVIKPGLGPDTRPHRGELITVNVTFFHNGIAFEEKESLKFIVGDFDVIQGLDLVVCLMEKEEKSRVIIPSKLAHGEIGRLPDVPPNSVIECDVELKDIETIDEEYFTLTKRLELGNKKRLRGNYFYDRGEFIDAIHCYERATEYLDGVRDCSDSTTGMLQEVVDVRLRVYNNMAAAHLKLCAYSAALKSLESVLKIQPHNIKALYRKAKILGMQGSTDEAIACLKMAARFEPEMKIIQIELTKLIKQKKREEESQRAMYQRMFKSEPKKPSVLSGIRKWSMFTCGVLAVAVGTALAYRQYHT